MNNPIDWLTLTARLHRPLRLQSISACPSIGDTSHLPLLRPSLHLIDSKLLDLLYKGKQLSVHGGGR